MSYVFDTNSISNLRFIFQSNFKQFWRDMQNLVNREKIISTREVKNELDVKFDKNKHKDMQMKKWINKNKDIFLTPTLEETVFVQKILSYRKFKGILEVKKFLQGSYFADPFIIALAKVKNACVVTEEEKKDFSVSIPNICEEFRIECTNFEGFMDKEKLEY
ncbi:MAG: DUF4411 family protein [Candidatus Poribacteria bacterium]|nr:DUF4411 family protein [Candidatus Poribacteria bacterium]